MKKVTASKLQLNKIKIASLTNTAANALQGGWPETSKCSQVTVCVPTRVRSCIPTGCETLDFTCPNR